MSICTRGRECLNFLYAFFKEFSGPDGSPSNLMKNSIMKALKNNLLFNVHFSNDFYDRKNSRGEKQS